MNAIEDFLLNQLAGKLLARACVTVAAAAAAGPAQALLAQAGINVTIDPIKLQGAVIILGHAAFEYFKAWRLKAAAAPAEAPKAP